MNGSDYKAIGVAVSKGGGDFVGTVVPIQQPEAGSGMHADPVPVRVRLDRNAGVITVKPIKFSSNGKLVNWIIKPNGFPSGSLSVPDSCGPFLKTLKTPDILAPLTGAEIKDSTVCVLHGSKADAFISWGNFKHDESSVDPLSIDGGIEPKFFSVGFVGKDRGVSIDICDRGGDDAARCEMSRIVGHTRKTFIVGDVKNLENKNDEEPLTAKKVEIVLKKKKKPKVKNHHIKKKKHQINHHIQKVDIKNESSSSSDEGEFCNIKPLKKPVHVHKEKRHHRIKKHHAKKEQVKSLDIKPRTRFDNILVKKIDTIERDLHSILARNEIQSDISDAEDVQVKKRHIRHHVKKRHIRHHAKKDFYSDKDDPDRFNHLPAIAPIPVRKHRVRQCAALRHPLIPPVVQNPNPRPLYPVAPVLRSVQPPIKDNTRILETNLIRRFNRLNNRLDRLDEQVGRTESIIAHHFSAFARWLRRQKYKMDQRTKEFVDYLEELKKNVVYTPISSTKKSENKFIKDIGKVFRKGTKTVENAIEAPVNVLKSPVHAVKAPVHAVKAHFNAVNKAFIDPVKDNVINPVFENVNEAASNVYNVSDNLFEGTLDGTRRAVVKTANSASNLVDKATDSTSGLISPVSRYDRFDFNDDLRTTLARGPGVHVAGTNPLGPIGPVLPPPVVKTFHDPEDQSVRDAIDYLN